MLKTNQTSPLVSLPMPIMPSSSSPAPLLSSALLFSFLVSLLCLLLLASPPISAAISNNTSTSYRAFSSTHPDKKCVHEHLSALLQLKRGFNLSHSFTNLSSWNLNNTDCCSWKGINCNAFTGHVTGLNLSRFFIAGVIDFESIFHLRSLQRLDLSANDFDGSPIPSGFGQLSSLTHLNLRRCHLYGQIPLDIFHLTRLVSLDLTYNGYDNGSNYANLDLESSGMGELFRNLSSLRELYLDWVNMSAVGSQWSRIVPYSLPNLRKLRMRECGLSGPIHPSLSRLHFLTLLDLSYNHLSSPVPEFISNLTSLTSLSLAECDLHHEFPKNIFNLPKLRSIDISGNQFLTIYLPEVSTNSTIQRLIMSETELHGNLAEILGSLKSLTDLGLSGCNILGPIPQFLVNLSHLANLDLSHNYFQGPIPQSLVNLSHLVNLDLSYNYFQGPIPGLIFSLAELRYLGLSSNNFGGVVDLGLFQNLKNLEWLDLSDNNFSAIIYTGNSSTSITQPCVNLSQLAYLDLSNINFQGPIPGLIFSLTELIYLRLSSNNFSGVVNQGLFQNLKNLVELDLSDNNFSAIINTGNSSTSVTQQWVNLSQIVYLDLSNNSFQGPIPRLIFELTELKVLDLSSNNFSGFIDMCSFENFKNLEELDLSHNSFSAIINARNSSTSTFFPQTCVNLSQLVRLDLSDNNFQGPIPVLIFELIGLTELLLSSNNFSGVMNLGLFQNPKNLEVLYLSNNSLSDIIDPGSNSISTSIHYLDLSSNRITGKIPRWVWKVGNGSLIYLNLSNNALEGLEGPFPHLSLSSMEFLDLSNNMLKGSILIPPPSSLFFSLANNTLDGEVPSLICDATSLEVLDLSNNNFTGMLPQCLGEMSNTLAVLNVRQNAFGGPLLQTFKVGCTLETFDLSDNQLEGQMPRSLANCKELTVLNLGNNQMTDGFPSQLANLLNLRVLVLRSNKFSGRIGQPLGSQEFFPMLQIIDLSSNNFGGSLPSNLFSAWKVMKDGGTVSEFLAANNLSSGWYYQDKVFVVSKGIEIEFVKILFAFTVVDLSHNQFDGDIPSSIGELRALHVLNMSHNHFEREIPSSLGNLRDLESLDLSNNSLSGKIPWQLTKLSFLAVLNLSRNQLIGSIPRGRQFDTFENDSFSGNPELCGHPLSRKCEEDATSVPPGQPDNESELDFMWIGFGVGHAVGFGIFFWTLALWRKGRRTFFVFVDRVLSSFLFFVKCSDM